MTISRLQPSRPARRADALSGLEARAPTASLRLSQARWRALRFRRDVRTGWLRCPQKTSFHTVLRQVDLPALERCGCAGRHDCWGQ